MGRAEGRARKLRLVNGTPRALGNIVRLMGTEYVSIGSAMKEGKIQGRDAEEKWCGPRRRQVHPTLLANLDERTGFPEIVRWLAGSNESDTNEKWHS
jgi:hypothetical protein